MIKHIFKLLWNKKKSNSLIMLEIFLSFLVLFGVLSYVFYNYNMLSKPLGFETENRLLVNFDDMQALDSIEVATNLPNLKTALKTIPEVEAVGYTRFITPFCGSQWMSGYTKEGVSINFRMAHGDEDYAKSLGIKIVEGSWFSSGADKFDFKPILMSKFFVDKFYTNEQMIGQIIPDIEEGGKVIGVFGEYKYRGEFEEEHPIVFTYVSPTSKDVAAAVISFNQPITPLLEKKVNDMIKSSFKGLNFTIEDLTDLKAGRSKSTWIAISVLSMICIFLCLNVALGLFGVLWYNIQKRRGEIGLRRAMGATKAEINIQFMLEIIFLAGVAIIIGLFFTIQIPIMKIVDIEQMIFYKAMALATLIVLTVVTLCALYPSNQASNLAPADVLHEE